MKASSNLYQDLKEDMELQNQKMMRLQIFQDDANDIIAKEKEDTDKKIIVIKDELER